MADANNVDVQQQLNKLLSEQKRIMSANTRSLREQVDLTKEMVESLSKASMNDSAVNKAKNLQNSLKLAADQAKSFGKQSQDMSSVTSGALDDTNEGFDGLIGKYGEAAKKTSVVGAAFGGMADGIGKTFSIITTGLSGILGLAGAVTQGIFSIGKSILSIPFKIFNEFVKEANRGGGGNELAKAYEETRKAFGDFDEDLSKHVIQGYKSLRGELAETGLSTYRVLGTMAERLNFVREQFEALGPVAHTFGLEIAQQAEYFAAYQKGLGLSGEHMKGLAQLTQGTGESFELTLRSATNFTTSLGKQFGISQKVIGRDIGEMSKDLKTFGAVGVREMAQLSVYSRKLGADFKDLLGVVDRFDNFEDAAESAAKLAQAFGVNIDAMEMIKEQDPAKRVDALRKAFYQTGKDITKLTRQERNYLATTAGIEDQALNAVFALDKQGTSYEDIATAGQNAEQAQITQVEAMKKLSDSIERLVKSGQKTGGFFDRFVEGFKKGMRRAGEFRQVMRNIRKALWQAEFAGRRVGQAFIKFFPGVKKMLQGIKEFFDPAKFARLGGKVSSAFTEFFKDLSDPQKAKQAVSKLFNALREAFFGMVGDQESAMSKIIDGFKSAFKAIGQIILSGLVIAIDSMTKFIHGLVKWIGGDTSFTDAMKEAFGNGADGATNVLLDGLTEAAQQLGGPMKLLGEALMELFDLLWGKIKAWWAKIDWWDVFKTVAKSNAGKLLAAAILGPAFIKGIASGLGAMVVNNFGAAGAKAGGLFGNAMKLAAANPMAALGVAAVALAGYIGVSVITEFRNLNKEIENTRAQIDKVGELTNARLAEYNKELLKRGVNEQMIASLYTGESLDQEKIKNSIKLNKLGAEELEILKKRATIIETQQIDELALEQQLLEQRKIRAWGGADDAKFDMMIAVNAAKQKALQEQRGEKQGMFGKAERSIEQDAKMKAWADKLMGKANLKIKNSPKKEEKMSASEMFGQFEQAKQLNPGQMKMMKSNLEKARELIAGPGGIKDQMTEIGNAFIGFDSTQFSTSAEAIHNLGGITAALQQTGKSKINQKGIEASIASSKAGIMSLVGLANDPSLNLGASAKKAEALGEEVIKLGSIPAAALNVAQGFTELRTEISQFAKAKNVSSLPIVKAIMNMVETSNVINTALSNINTGNIKPKLDNLSKALGLTGSDEIKINHENFNININVAVELNPTKLADAMVDTKRFVESTKTKKG
jgi:hypothetical protein